MLARDVILLNDFHDANDVFRCSLWVEIRKFQKWLYNLHMNPIATRRNVKSDFRIQPRNVIVRAQKTQPNTRKYGIKEDLNQNDDRIISRKLEQYQRFLQILIINIYVFTTLKDSLKMRSVHVVF